MKRQRLGQHYLVDSAIINRMIAIAAIEPHEHVLEIGTGRGVLTARLASLGASFVGYEVDRDNLAATRQLISKGEGTVHLRDVFKETPSFDVLVSSLPYSRSATFIEWISHVPYDRAVVLLQEDFVEKVLAPPGARAYRAVSVIGQASSEFHAVMRVERSSFKPTPRVSSLLVTVRPRRRMSEREVLQIRRLFSLRRREVTSAAQELGIALPRVRYGKRRVNSLTPEEVLEICHVNTVLEPSGA